MKIYSLVFLLLIYSWGSSQESNFNILKTEFNIQQFDSNIYKIIYKPNLYVTNENISNAVILKPKEINYNLLDNYFKQNKIIIGKQSEFVLSSTFKNETSYGFNIELKNNSKIYGGGERAISLNRRGYSFNLYNNPWYGYSEGADNLNYSVPFFISTDGYGVFFDNPSKGFADIGKTKNDIFTIGFMSGELNCYVILGKNTKEILSSFHKLTGTQPLPPIWAMGNLMSRFGYTSQQQLDSIIQITQQQNIPFDAVIFDLFWFGDSIKGTMGNLEWVNKKAWPNPQKMLQDYKKQGINPVIITEPFVLQSSLNYQNSIKYHAVDSFKKPFVLNDFYFGKAGLFDIFRNDAKSWFWNQHKKQIQLGVEGLWGDLGEPEKHPNQIFHNLKDLGFNRMFSADEVHNLYGHTWTQMLDENFKKDFPNKRLFSLNRSGFAGTQRFNIFPWSGDVSRSWSGLRAQLPIMLGMSLSGVPYIHADAGGFAGGNGDAELYTRWLQFASFTPIFRPHGTALYEIEKNAFSFPSEPALMNDPYKSIVKTVVDERYKWLPYNYTLSYLQTTKAEPLVSPLLYYYSTDTVATSVEDEYMWGENVLVAPVLEKNLQKRKLYLPNGNWYQLGDNKLYAGKQWHSVSVNNFEMPVFIKEGGFVTKYRIVPKNTANLDKTKLSIIYIPSENASSNIVFEDDGLSRNSLDKKEFEIIQLNSTGLKNNNLTIQISTNKGSYIGKPTKRNILFTIPTIDKLPKKVLINNKVLSVKTIEEIGMVNVEKHCIWMGMNSQILTIPIEFTDKPLKISISF